MDPTFRTHALLVAETLYDKAFKDPSCEETTTSTLMEIRNHVKAIVFDLASYSAARLGFVLGRYVQDERIVRPAMSLLHSMEFARSGAMADAWFRLEEAAGELGLPLRPREETVA